MRIFITTMDDPLVTNDFIKKIIEKREKNIIGLAVSKPAQLKTKKSYNDLSYAISLLIISGIVESIKQIVKVIDFKIKKFLSKIFKKVKSPSIIQFARERGIPTWEVNSINNFQFLQVLKELKPDIIINQAQEILKKDFLSIPKIGVISRHNSLLPKYRGRLAPFWALYNKEKETGVTIHFVTEKIDAGAIIVQKKIKIDKYDDYVILTKKCYEIAPQAMMEAIEILENNKNFKGQKISKKKGSYYSHPSIKDAIKYRKIFRSRG